MSDDILFILVIVVGILAVPTLLMFPVLLINVLRRYNKKHYPCVACGRIVDIYSECHDQHQVGSIRYKAHFPVVELEHEQETLHFKLNEPMKTRVSALRITESKFKVEDLRYGVGDVIKVHYDPNNLRKAKSSTLAWHNFFRTMIDVPLGTLIFVAICVVFMGVMIAIGYLGDLMQ